MVFKDLCILVLSTKLAIALDGLITPSAFGVSRELRLDNKTIADKYLTESCFPVGLNNSFKKGDENRNFTKYILNPRGCLELLILQLSPLSLDEEKNGYVARDQLLHALK